MMLHKNKEGTEVRMASCSVEGVKRFPKELKVVFVSNAENMVLKAANSTQFTVNYKDVNMEGELRQDGDPVYQAILNKVKAGVSLRFRFGWNGKKTTASDDVVVN